MDNDDVLDLVLGKLDGVSSRGGYWTARCPALDHEDRNASLSVRRGDDQPVIFKCHAGCDRDAILDGLGLTLADVSASRKERPAEGEWTPRGTAVNVYDYTDEEGGLLFQVLRTADKQFPQRIPDRTKKSGWKWSLGTTRRIPYRLPAVIAAIAERKVVYIVEGEKDVQSVERAGGIATTNPGGAGKWRAEYDKFFTGATVVIIADRDDPGRKHAADVQRHLKPVAKSVTVAEPAVGKDATDHLDAGHSLAEFSRGAAVTLDTVRRERVTWLWPGRLAYGKLGIIDGDPGLGKSVITLDIAARVSTGSPMPGDPPRGPLDPRGVLVCCAEDDIADTVIPRLESHHADLKRIGYIPLARDDEGRLIPLTIPRDLNRIEAAIRQLGARLMVIDPITAYLPETVQTHNDASVRRALTPLADVAQRTGCAILLVRHLNKDTKGPAIYRGGGSIAFSGSARTALVTAKHPDDGKTCVLARVKGNLSVAVASLAYRLAPDDENECPHVAWGGAVDIDADTLLRGKDKRFDAPARDKAAGMIRQILGEGPKVASAVMEMVTQGAGCSQATVTRAGETIGVLTMRQTDSAGKTTGWLWQLPPISNGSSSTSGRFWHQDPPDVKDEDHGPWDNEP